MARKRHAPEGIIRKLCEADAEQAIPGLSSLDAGPRPWGN